LKVLRQIGRHVQGGLRRWAEVYGQQNPGGDGWGSLKFRHDGLLAAPLNWPEFDFTQQ
jgi:hypothetical protein